MHRMAGAAEVVVASSRRMAHVIELHGAREPTLAAIVGRLGPCDLVLVEGFKREPLVKLEVFRAAVGKPALHTHDPSIVALASDVAPAGDLSPPWCALDDTGAVRDLVLSSAEPLAATLARLEAGRGAA